MLTGGSRVWLSVGEDRIGVSPGVFVQSNFGRREDFTILGVPVGREIGHDKLRGKDRSQLVITHYQRLLNYIVPDFVHVLADGRILRTGDKQLALELEKKGYDWLLKEAAVAA